VIRQLTIVFLVFSFAVRVLSAEAGRPNVIFILVDDYGWTDAGSFGSDLYETPNLDRLVRDGMKFTQAYSACTVCSPSRASILTGKYPARLHVTDWIPGLVPENSKLIPPDWTKYLAHEETTIADVYKAAGYATASIGKWHLGGPEYYPTTHGFDLNVAGTEAAQPTSYFAPYKIATLPEGPKGEYLTDRLGDEALKFIEQSKDKPFFLYFPHFAVHLPVQGKKGIADKYRAKLRPGLTHTNAVYAAMIESMDETVGRIRAKLDELKLAGKTILFLTGDNGGHIPTTSNRPLRYGKASAYEGGVRVPLVVYWPGVTKVGSVSDTPVIGPDYYPTMLEMTGLKDLAGHRADGVSMVPLLRQTGGLGRNTIYWHYPHYQLYQQGGTTPYGAIRSGDWKLIEFFDDMRVELYNVRADIGEQHDLAATEPARTRELRDRLHAWRTETGAQMPARNTKYDTARPEYQPAGKMKKQAEKCD
jgi:arylsulfatase A-like enzyme